MKAAIVQFLALHGEKWIKRSEIEEALELESTYLGYGKGSSYEGALASMLLSELVSDGLVERRKDGQPWVYRATPHETQN